MRFGLSKNSAGNFLLVCASASSATITRVSVLMRPPPCFLASSSNEQKNVSDLCIYIYVENFRSFAHLLHTPVRRLMKSVYDNSVGATAMCSLRCAHTPPQPCYVLTALRAYARLMGLRLCAHCVARIRLRSRAMCSLRCAHTHGYSM